jgi:isoquinoline 1-oxidoreductase beta subunit
MSMSSKSGTTGLSRRKFLQVGTAAGGGLMLGFQVGGALAQAPAPKKYVLNPNAFIAIARDGKVSFQIPQEEMGQGVYTALSQLLADELDVDFANVTPLPAPPSDALYASPKGRRQSTGGSTSIRGVYTALRQVGASGRAMMVEAAAQQWGISAASLRTENGQVIDDAHGGRKLSYGELAPRAAKLPAPQEVKLKADKDLKYIGKPVKRLDTPDKVNGKAQYGIDVRMDGLKVAAIAAAPVVGGKVARVDDSKMKAMPGLQLVALDDLVAVVGPNFWAAKKGLDALAITWNDGENAKINSDAIWRDLEKGTQQKGAIAKEEGDVEKSLKGDRFDAAYEMPFLAHAPMEPQNFTVHVKKDGTCELWGGSQVQTATVKAASDALGIALEKVTFHNYMLGGGFGRRLATDMVTKSVRVAQKVDGPVKVIWTREEDIQQDMYRPAYRNAMSASLTKDGKIDGWTHRIAGGSVIAAITGGKPLKDGLDGDAVEGAVNIPYAIPNLRVEYAQTEPKALNLGWWRGVGPNNAVFAIESMMDDLAKKAGKDPVAFRLAHLGNEPRLKAILQTAADKSGWGKPLAARSGRGVCAQHAFGSYIATVTEVDVTDMGKINIRRIISVVDAGRTVNPDTIAAQVQGGILFGMTAALYGDITLKNGRVQQRNFNDYRMMRINEVPSIEVHVVPSTEDPGGIGEPGCSAGPPALVNAVFAATGVRIHRLPIDRTLLMSKKVA